MEGHPRSIVGLGLRHGIWSVLGHCSVAGEEAKVGTLGLSRFNWKIPIKFHLEKTIYYYCLSVCMFC